MFYLHHWSAAENQPDTVPVYSLNTELIWSSQELQVIPKPAVPLGCSGKSPF